jgi:hypothetical protein
MNIKIDNECYNTENCGIPIAIAFRVDELHNLLMSLLKNPAMQKIAVFPPGWGSQGETTEEKNKASKEARQKFMDLVPVPETPKVTKDAIKFLRKAAINKLLNNPDSFDAVVDSEKDIVKTVVIGDGLDK